MNKPAPLTCQEHRSSRPVFISYATADRKEALSICRAIERRGIQCWISTRDVEPGGNYQEEIVHAIRDSRAVMLIFSDAANHSDEIKKELSVASRHHVPVIALRIEDVEPSDAFEYELATRQWVDAIKGRDRALDGVVRCLEHLDSVTTDVTTEQLHPRSEVRGTPTWHRVSRRTLVGGVVASGAVLIGGAVLYRTVVEAPPKSWNNGQITLAVLPFVAPNGSPELAELAGQLSDGVRSDLSRVADIRVSADTSSRSAAKEEPSPARIGKLLGANLLVQGEISNDNGRLLATLSMIDAAKGTEIWAGRASAAADDAIALRSEVAGGIVQQLAGMIPFSRAPAFSSKRPDPQAYALVLQANRLLEDIRTAQMRGHSDEGLALGAKADALARQALAIDPSDAGALATLATITRNGWTPALARQPLTTEQRVQQSIAIVRRALLADPRNPAALTQLGDYYRRFAFRWDEAETLFRKALMIDPSLVDAHWSYAYELGATGRGIEGLDHALSVFELDPRNPFRRVALPRLLYLIGERAQAMQRYQSELRAQPDNLFLLRELYLIFLTESSASDLLALRSLVQRSLRGTTPAIVGLTDRIDAAAQALQGRPGRLHALVDADVKQLDQPSTAGAATVQGRAKDDLPFIFAVEYAWSGAPSQSLDMLDLALASKSIYWPPTLPYGPTQFPPAVRNNVRFQDLWERDPGLRELINRRRRAVENATMAGVRPDGRKVVPSIPSPLASRVRSALAQA